MEVCVANSAKNQNLNTPTPSRGKPLTTIDSTPLLVAIHAQIGLRPGTVTRIYTHELGMHSQLWHKALPMYGSGASAWVWWLCKWQWCRCMAVTVTAWHLVYTTVTACAPWPWLGAMKSLDQLHTVDRFIVREHCRRSFLRQASYFPQ
jgi:hypothetical protein